MENDLRIDEGYVTGIEPATNFPNPKPFERNQGRVVMLQPGGSHHAEMVVEFADGVEAVQRVVNEIATLQAEAKNPSLTPFPDFVSS